MDLGESYEEPNSALGHAWDIEKIKQKKEIIYNNNIDNIEENKNEIKNENNNILNNNEEINDHNHDHNHDENDHHYASMIMYILNKLEKEKKDNNNNNNDDEIDDENIELNPFLEQEIDKIVKKDLEKRKLIEQIIIFIILFLLWIFISHYLLIYLRFPFHRHPFIVTFTYIIPPCLCYIVVIWFIEYSKLMNKKEM